jgi:indolepyruvate decarboxylase
MTVIQHVLSRLRSIGVSDVFGVPGDFSFPVCDAICEDPQMRWIGCCNELNAAYAADGYARIKGMGAVCTTYGVGELSALNGIAGAYAEHLPLFHLVGTPNMGAQSTRALMHHTLGNGEYNLFQRMTEPVVCAQAVMHPQNVAMETERLIAEALYHRRPVYMAFPADHANEKVVSAAQPLPPPQSDPAFLTAATDAIVAALDKARSACFLPGILLARTGLQSAMQAVIDASDLPFATMFMGKSVLDEQHPNYIGMYDGALMNEDVRAFVEGCDLVLEVGTMLSDFNSGAFTAKLDPARIVNITHHRTRIAGKIYPSVEIGDILKALHSGCRNIAALKGRRFPRSASLSGKGPTRSPPQRSTRGGRTSCGQTISSWRIPAPLPWVLASRVCRQVHPSIIKRYGARSAGRRPPRSARRLPPPSATWCWSPAKVHTSLPRKR